MSLLRTGMLIAALAGLGGCYSKVHLDQNFGQSMRESLASQIADPDARYTGEPAPGSAGARVALAQDKYQTGTVIKPQATTTSAIQSGGSGR